MTIPGTIPSSPLNLFIPVTFDDAPPEVAGYLNQILNSLRLLQAALTQYTGAAQYPSTDWQYLAPEDTVQIGNLGRLYAKASEAIAYGAVISIENVAGVMKIRNANATDNTRPGLGWCSTVGGIASGDFGEVIIGPSLCTAISGMTIGTRYFLDTTNGLVVNAEPAAAGNIGQALGIALAANRLYFMPSLQWVQH